MVLVMTKQMEMMAQELIEQQKRARKEIKVTILEILLPPLQFAIM